MDDTEDKLINCFLIGQTQKVIYYVEKLIKRSFCEIIQQNYTMHMENSICIVADLNYIKDFTIDLRKTTTIKVYNYNTTIKPFTIICKYYLKVE